MRFWMTSFAMMLVCTAASANVISYCEDFEDGTDPGFDPIFNHAFSPIGSLSYSVWEITEFIGPDYDLGLWPATDLVTFNLQPNKVVEYASVDLMNAASSSTIRFIGTSGEHTIIDRTHAYQGFLTFDTEGLNLGQITAIELTSNEGIYDNITIHVIPEPAGLSTLAGLLLTGIAFRLHRFRP